MALYVVYGTAAFLLIFLVGIIKRSVKTMKATQQSAGDIDAKLAAANFTTTSSHDLMSPYSTIPTVKMCVDSNSKQIAFINLMKNAETTFVEFDKLLSCEIVHGAQSSKSSALGGHVGYGVGVGMSSTETYIQGLKLLITVKSIDTPTLDIVLIDRNVSTKSAFDYAPAIGFAEKAKAVIDNIISMRD